MAALRRRSIYEKFPRAAGFKSQSVTNCGTTVYFLSNICLAFFLFFFHTNDNDIIVLSRGKTNSSSSDASILI